MLKRCQVLLSEWLADHIKTTSEKYDMSFSEIIRLALCLQIVGSVSKAYPQCRRKLHLASDVFVDIISNKFEGKINQEKLHKLISQIYFEGRKATECSTTCAEANAKGRKTNGCR